MGFLNILPGKKEIMKRVVIALIDGLNDHVDTKEEQVELAKWLNDKVDIPLYTEEEEQKVFEQGLEKLNEALQMLEGHLRNIHMK